eukprot:6136673-Alexandrium_andersonii.AAC.1
MRGQIPRKRCGVRASAVSPCASALQSSRWSSSMFNASEFARFTASAGISATWAECAAANAFSCAAMARARYRKATISFYASSATRACSA